MERDGTIDHYEWSQDWKYKARNLMFYAKRQSTPLAAVGWASFDPLTAPFVPATGRQ